MTILHSLSKSITRKRNFVSAEVVNQKLHASITLEFWKRSARQIRACWPLAALPDSLDPESQFVPGALALSPVLVCSPASSLSLLFSGLCSLCGVRSCLISAVSRACFWGLAMSRAESLRRLAAQLSSLANLEAAVAHDVQALLEAPPEPVVPIPATGPVSRLAHLRPRSSSRSPLPKAAPGRPRGSLLLNQRGPTGLSVKCSLVAPPDRSVSSCRHSCSSASANGPVESRSTAGVARSPTPRESRAAASAPTATVARKASQMRRASGAAEVQQRRRDKHRRRARRATKRSMWREI